MTTIQLLVELTYDAQVMHGNDPAAIAWFFEQVLGQPDGLSLFSAVLGDEIGTIRVLSPHEYPGGLDGLD